jgi:hypothetical protein
MWKPTGLNVKRPFAKVVRSLASLEAELAMRTEFSFQKTMLRDEVTFEGAALLWWTADGTSDGQIAGEALAIDMGEPGRSDFFELVARGSDRLVSIGAGLLAGGNVQMHGKCSATGA